MIKFIEKHPKGAALAMACIFWIAFVISLMGSGRLAFLFPGSWSRMVYGVLGTLAAFLLVRLFYRPGKRSFRDAGLVWETGTFPRFAAGLLIGAVLFVLLVLPLIAFTPLRFTRTPMPLSVSVFTGYLALLPLAFMEEVAFRSYTLLKLNKAFGFRWAQLVTALAFALYHVANGWDLYTAFTGTFTWAFIYGLAAARSNGIAVSTGIHVAVNALQKLAGMGGSTVSVYKAGFPDGTSAAMITRAGKVQLAATALMLLLTLLYTEMLIKRKGIRRYD